MSIPPQFQFEHKVNHVRKHDHEYDQDHANNKGIEPITHLSTHNNCIYSPLQNYVPLSFQQIHI
jgi:hypothetical protein